MFSDYIQDQLRTWRIRWRLAHRDLPDENGKIWDYKKCRTAIEVLRDIKEKYEFEMREIK